MTPHARSVGRQMIDDLELRFGRGFDRTLSRAVVEELLSARAFQVMQTAAREDVTGEALAEWGRQVLEAATWTLERRAEGRTARAAVEVRS